MKVKMAINTVTIKPVPFLEKLRLISGAGFSGVGLWMEEVEAYLKGANAKPIKELLAEYQLAPVEMQLIRRWQYLAGVERKQAFDEAKDFFMRFSKLGLDCPVVALPPEEVAGEMRDGVKDFKELCGLAGDFGVRVMFEFTGWAKQFHNVTLAWEIVREADCPNGGMLIDTFHVIKGGSSIEDLRQVSMDKVFLIHVNDVKTLPLGIREQSRGFRFFPGEGEAPLKEIMKCFVEKNYKGFYCIEIFNEKYWAEDPATVVSKSKKSLEALFPAFAETSR
jgi:sugar phosphate isomerase/epimerase